MDEPGAAKLGPDFIAQRVEVDEVHVAGPGLRTVTPEPPRRARGARQGQRGAPLPRARGHGEAGRSEQRAGAHGITGTGNRPSFIAAYAAQEETDKARDAISTVTVGRLVIACQTSASSASVISAVTSIQPSRCRLRRAARVVPRSARRPRSAEATHRTPNGARCWE